MTSRDYDALIEQHYRDVARTSGLSPSSTMADEITRRTETDAIVRLVGDALRMRSEDGRSGPAVIMDVGCGNGYTLEVLSDRYREHRGIGIEKSAELRALAASRFRDRPGVLVAGGDIRARDFAAGAAADILVCQRVLINLLDPGDQRQALENVIDAVRPLGTLLFIECFQEPLVRLNEARREFDLPPIEPAYHNLYLPDDFFRVSRLTPWPGECPIPPNFLSTHYYVTRVLHPLLTRDRAMKRNSEFVQFFSRALPPGVGDYSPLKIHAFRRSDHP
jgi:SAM-dependent methyltransferase